MTMDITARLPLNPWVHVVVQGSNFTNGTLSVYLNGILQTQLSPKQKTVGRWSVRANTAGSISFPANYSTLKHLRLYSRSLTQAEISANYNDHCFLIATASAAGVNTGWYRFNVPAAGSFTTVSATSTNESTVNPVYPNHGLRTTYVYNANNQVILQNSPDGGTNRFWYDWLARLVTSQNDKQLPGNNYSYTTFDAIGRITEVGQKNQTTVPLNSPHYLPADTTGYLYAAGTNSQITHTYYDTIPAATGGIHALTQNNLRKRVALSTYKENQADTVMHATYYNYDLDGNVKTLYQQITGLGIKQIDYEYDLISGKVNFVRYQDGKKDQFYYKYDYDADNRLTDAWSGIYAMVDSINGSVMLPDYQKQDAHYDYYLHGPLARMELGDHYGKVQGVDYAYTLQGWLKGTNSTSPLITKDMGQDAGTVNPTIARDAYGYALHYFGNNDYKPIGTVNPFADATGTANYKPLYNGNIAAQTISIKKLGLPMLYVYGYDQLNRIKRANAFTGLDSATNIWAPIDSGKYRENFTYDGNGNILRANRTGNVGAMDSLQYQYSYDSNGHLANNKLNYVTDKANDIAYTTDIKNQPTNNYTYDAIGNLIHDTQAGIDSINWSVYGKIKKVAKGSIIVTYTYDPGGQRVTKTADGITTYYVRDGQGNTLALYDNTGTHGNWREQHLYGSSRLGMWTPNVNLATGNAQTVYDTLGRKFFELNNHLGNVLATITDRRLQAPAGTTVDHFEADVASAQSYYAFGMEQPGLTYNAGSYRYGFNGKENDKDIENGAQDYGERIYNDRLGKFLSVDPLMESYPMLTPYQFSSDSPIGGVDLDGREFFGSGYLIDALSEGVGKLGLTRTAGFISSYGHSLSVDPIYSAVNVAKHIVNKQYVSVAQDFDPTPVSGVINLYQIGKKALNGDEFAQGQFLGSLPAIYGGLKGAKVAVGNEGVPTPGVEPEVPPVQNPANGNAPIEIGISKSKHPESASHLEEAIKNGIDNEGVVDRTGAADRRRNNLKNVETEKRKDRDEVPPAVIKNKKGNSSVKKISPSDNRGAGGSIGQQIKNLPDGTKVKIVVKP